MKVRIVNKSNNQLPTYATPGSAGFDFRADVDHDIVLNPGERCLIPTGLYVEIPEGYELRVQSRSGLALKNAVIVANTPGCVDSDYRGMVQVILINFGNDPFIIHSGDRIAQGIISPVVQAEWEKVDELSSTERGAGGFGSSGVK